MFRIDTSKKPMLAGIVITVALMLVLIIGSAALFIIISPVVVSLSKPSAPKTSTLAGRIDGVARFADEAEFAEWMSEGDAKARQMGYAGITFRSSVMTEMDMVAESSAPPGMGLGLGTAETGIGGVTAERFSDTNVQVTGIDEPDIIKTDGKEIYYAPRSGYYFPMPMIGMMDGRIGVVPPDMYRQPGVKAIAAFPPEDMKLDAEIGRTGDLLLHDDILAVFSYDGIYAYDVSDPAAPADSWNYSLEKDNYPVASRLREGKLYVVLAGGIDRGRPCPYVPVLRDGQDVTIACDRVWHPVIPTPADVTYTVLKIDMATGATERTVSFVGSRSSSAVHMSADNLYVTNVYPPDTFTFMTGFLGANGDIVPAWVVKKIQRVAGYDLSEEARLVELRNIMGQWADTMDDDEKLRVGNELENRVGIWFDAHSRDLQSTGIVRISVDGLEVAAAGDVPGTLLNQFSLDEYSGHLRAAVTVGGSDDLFWRFGFGGSGESANDVYVLDMSLSIVGRALDMGRGERIYSVRFLGDKGYVVTFRQIDPFYVLDLADPRAPLIKGELKIPGYSSYLHPMPDGSVLGIGKEDNNVKISLFDVSDASSPAERSKYVLNEYWSDILETHHAFLLDAKHRIFFLPGGNGGYVFSYEGNDLNLVKAVSGLSARRALYIDDYLYVAGDDRIVVLDMEDWERVKELRL